MKIQFSLLLTLFLSIVFIACNSEETDQSRSESTEVTKTTTTTNPLDSLHPEHISEDLSWFVTLDIQEGFLISYTITRQDGKEFVISVEKEDPSTGGVDHPEPHFINDSTYFIPVVGGSPNGYYEMYIYENGTHEFKEIIKKH